MQLSARKHYIQFILVCSLLQYLISVISTSFSQGFRRVFFYNENCQAPEMSEVVHTACASLLNPYDSFVWKTFLVNYSLIELCV